MNYVEVSESVCAVFSYGDKLSTRVAGRRPQTARQSSRFRPKDWTSTPTACLSVVTNPGCVSRFAGPAVVRPEG